jgi:hypothetical protein
LGSLTNETTLVDENGQPCHVKCITDKTKSIIKHAGGTARKSLHKLGLRKSLCTAISS